MLETIVGGRRNKSIFRPELGETVAALSPEGSTSFQLLAPRTKIAYTDAGWQEFAEQEEARLARLEADSRARLLKQNAPALEQRRALGPPVVGP